METPNPAAVRRQVELLPIDAVEDFLDAHGLGSGPPAATRIGDGASNLTYLVEREGARVVLRRPPPPPLPPSAHDMVRESRVQLGLARAGVRLPRAPAAPLGGPVGPQRHARPEGVPHARRAPAGLDAREPARHGR